MLASHKLTKEQPMRPVSLKVVFLSFLLAFIFHLMPWSGLALWLQPEFMLLVLIYWVLRAPYLCNVGVAWFVGLTIDLATGSLLGQHALVYAFTAFLAVSYQRRLTLFDVWQQAAFVLLLLIIERGLLFVLKIFNGGENPGWPYFAACISGLVLWLVMSFSRFGLHLQLRRA